MPITLGTGLIGPAFRVAGITDRPGRIASTDQSNEGITILNRMIGNWNIRQLAIYSTVIASYPLTGAKTYTIGPGGAFDTARPARIVFANVIVPGWTDLRYPLRLLSDLEWASIRMQDLPGIIPANLYNDHAHPLSTLYLYGQPIAGYLLELGTREQIAAFAALADSVVLPPGYEQAIVYNLARLIAAQFPSQSHMSADSLALARESLADVMSDNAPSPEMTCDPAMTGAGKRNRGWSHLFVKSGGY